MTLEQIKNEITASLKEVRESSRDFSGCESYDDLQSLFKKALGRVALCESAADIEAVGDLLMAIEELYNDCNSEFLNQPSEIELFSFDFELDEDQTDLDEDPDEELEEEDEEEEEEEETEDNEDSEGSDNDPKKQKSKSNDKKKKKNATKGKEKEEDSDRSNETELKSAFDKKYPVSRLRKPNIMRLCVGCVALLSGIGFGLVDALWWPWEWYAWTMIGFGVSYLLLCAIYAAAIASKSKKAVRAMAVTRLVLAFIMIIASLILGLALPDDLTVGGAYIATIPFTVFGVLTYFIYRIRLTLANKADKKKSKKK